MSAPSPSAQQWATSKDWERHKDEISTLYQKSTLANVITHMEQVHNFRATFVPPVNHKRTMHEPGATNNLTYHSERMYKFRIKTWGLRKNWGNDLVQQTLQDLRKTGTLSPANHAPLLGTQPHQRLRRLERYIKRNPGTLQKLVVRTHDATDQRDLAAPRDGVKDQPTTSRCEPRPIRPAFLRGPSQFEQPDEIFRLLKSFLTSTPHQSMLTIPKPPEQDELMLHFVLKLRLSHSLILTSQTSAGFTCLSMCFSQLSAMPISLCTTLLYIINAALEVSLDFPSLPEILSHVFRYLYRLAKIRVGEGHPATEIAKRFSGIDKVEYPVVLGLMRRLRGDHYHQICESDGGEGFRGEVAFGMYDKAVDSWVESRERDSLPGLQRMLAECEDANESELMMLWMRMRVAIALLDQGKLDPVVGMLKDKYPAAVLEMREPLRASLILQCYKIKGHMWAEEGALDTAEAVFRRGGIIADATWGKGNEVSLGFAGDARRVGMLRRHRV